MHKHASLIGSVNSVNPSFVWYIGLGIPNVFGSGSIVESKRAREGVNGGFGYARLFV